MIDDTFDSELQGEEGLPPTFGLPGNDHQGFRRRTILKALAALGAGTATFRRALAAQSAAAGKVTPDMIKQAEWIAGLELTDKERQSAAKEVQESLGSFQRERKGPPTFPGCQKVGGPFRSFGLSNHSPACAGSNPTSSSSWSRDTSRPYSRSACNRLSSQTSSTSNSNGLNQLIESRAHGSHTTLGARGDE